MGNEEIEHDDREGPQDSREGRAGVKGEWVYKTLDGIAEGREVSATTQRKWGTACSKLVRFEGRTWSMLSTRVEYVMYTPKYNRSLEDRRIETVLTAK